MKAVLTGATLALDTSSGTSVALLPESGPVVEWVSADPLRHAEAIGELLASVLAEAGAAPSAVTRVVAGMGPGPFTGLRVGIVAARAFALAVGARFLPVVSHDAPAWDAWSAGARGELTVVTDARRRELYWTRYRLGDDGLWIVDGPALAAPADVPAADGSRIEHPAISAAALARRAHWMLEHDAVFPEDRALYLRSPDVTPSSGPKRVTR